MLHAGELLHGRSAAIGSELGLPPNPVGALPGDGPLGEPVLEPNLELGAKEALLLARAAGYGIPCSRRDLVCHFAGNKGRGREDELKGVNLLQFSLKASKRRSRSKRRQLPPCTRPSFASGRPRGSDLRCQGLPWSPVNQRGFTKIPIRAHSGRCAGSTTDLASMTEYASSVLPGISKLRAICCVEGLGADFWCPQFMRVR